LKNKKNVKEIIYDVLENTLCDRKDSELDEREYYLYDRSDFSKRYFRDDKDYRYDDDIETISTLIKQISLFGEVIYEDDNGKIMNTNIDEKYLQEDLNKVDEMKLEMGDVGLIFLKFVFDNITNREKIKYLNDFRVMVFDMLNDKDENTEELSTQMGKLKTDLEDNISDDTNPKIVSGVVDNYIFTNTKMIDKYLQRIGFDKDSLLKFFQEII
jgi:hypothetical protein